MSDTVFFAPADRRALVLPGMPADKTYTFEIRAYRKVDPDVALGGVVLSPAVTTAGYKPINVPEFSGDIKGTIQGRPSLSVVLNLEAIASDAVLSTAEKPGLIIEHARAMDEYTKVDAKAATFGTDYSTQRLAATNAKATLDSYLASLTPAWNDTTQHTSIVAATFQSNWAAFYSALADLSTAITARQGPQGVQGDPGPAGPSGPAGYNSAVVYLFRRSASAPSAPTTTATYTFATGVLTGQDGGWTQSVPAGTDPLYVITGTASSTAATDTIAAGEWSSPVIHAQNGATGATGPAGLNSASVYLYRRSASVPAVPSTTATYTFATAALTGHNNSWVQTVPAGTDPIYVITATASSTGASDTIATGEWSTPAILAQNGEDGATGPQGPQGPAIEVAMSPGDFTYVNGVLSPGSQTITFTATLQNTSGTINWTTSPNIKTGTGSSFTINNTEMGSNAQVSVTATVGAVSKTVLLRKGADPAATPNPVYQAPTAPTPVNGGIWYDGLEDLWIGNGGAWERAGTIGARLGTNFRSPTGVSYTQGQIETSLGTAAAITGQSAWATYSTLAPTTIANRTQNLDGTTGNLSSLANVTTRNLSQLDNRAWTNLFRANGSTAITDADAITSLGTAAGFTGQGALATKSTVTYGTGDVTGFGALAARAKISLNDGFVFRQDGSTALTDATTVTALGTAAAISGQSAWATSSIPTARLNNLSDTGELSSLANVTTRNLSQLNNRAWTSLFRANGSTAITDADAITSLGVASAINGQSSWATYSDANNTPSKLAGIDAGATASENLIPNGDMALASAGGTPTGYSLLSLSEGDGRWNLVTAPSGEPWKRYFEVLAGNTGNYFLVLPRANTLPVPTTGKLQVTGFMQAGDAYSSTCRLSATIRWANNLGAFLSQDSINYVHSTVGAVEAFSVSATPPAGAAFAEIRVKFTVNTGYIRAGLFRVSGLEPGSTKGATIGVDAKLSTGTIPTQAQLITSEGVASAITGQSAWATYSTLAPTTVANRTQNLDGTTGNLSSLANITTRNLSQLNGRAWTNLFRSNGTTAITDADAITSLGTAAGFTGQGALATKSTVTYGTADVTGFGSMAARAKVSLGDGFVFRADGTTGLTDALAVTSLGTAAAITGQSAWATSTIPTARLNNLSDTGNLSSLANVTTRDLSQLNGRAWTNLFRANGTTAIADADAITSLGTAAGFTGQGALATKSTVTYGTADVTGFAALAAKATLTFGDAEFRESGATVATLSNFKTALGTAAGFTGQGALATKNSVDLATGEVANKSLANVDSAANTKLNGVEATADVTKSIKDGPAEISITYDSSGAAVTSLPLAANYKLVTAAGSAVTTGVTWAVTVVSGTASASISGTGTGALSVASLGTNEAVLTISATQGGRSYYFTVKLKKTTLAAPTGGGGGSSSATDSTLTVFSSTSFVVVSDEMSITLPAGVTTATLTATNVSIELTTALPLGLTHIEMKWQRESSPGTWVDVGATESSSSSPNSSPEVFDEGDGFRQMYPGVITCNRSATGLSVGSSQKFRLAARVSGGNTRSVTLIPSPNITVAS